MAEADEDRDKLYDYDMALSEAADQGTAQEHADTFKKVLEVAGQESSSDNAKWLAASIVPKHVKNFPQDAEAAINAQFDLVESPSKKIRMTAIANLHLMCKDIPEYVPRIADALCQMLVADDELVKQKSQQSFFVVLGYDVKKALEGLFAQANTSPDVMQFFLDKVLPEVGKNEQYKAAPKEVDAYIIEECAKVLTTLPAEDYAMWARQIKKLVAKDDRAAVDRMVITAIEHRAELPAQFDPADSTSTERILTWAKTATPYLRRATGLEEVQLPAYLFTQMLPRCSDLPAKSQKVLLEAAADLAPKARPDDARACLESIVGMVAAMAPEDGSPKALEFDTLETLLYCIGHLSVKAPGMFNSLTGIKTFTGLMNDGSLEDHPDKRAAFDQKMKALVGCCKHCLPQLKKANGENQKKLKSFKGEAGDKAKLSKTVDTYSKMIYKVQNIQTIAQAMVDVKKELPDLAGVRLSWVPRPAPKKPASPKRKTAPTQAQQGQPSKRGKGQNGAASARGGSAGRGRGNGKKKSGQGAQPKPQQGGGGRGGKGRGGRGRGGRGRGGRGQGRGRGKKR